MLQPHWLGPVQSFGRMPKISAHMPCTTIICKFKIVYYKSLLDSNLRENNYNLGITNESNYYLFYVKKVCESELYSTFQVIYMINIVFLLKFCWQPGYKSI